MKLTKNKKKEKAMLKEKRRNCAFMIEPSLLKKVDFYATKIGVTRSLLIRNMIDSGVDDLKLFDKTGTLKSINFFRSIKEKNILNNEKGIAI